MYIININIIQVIEPQNLKLQISIKPKLQIEKDIHHKFSFPFFEENISLTIESKSELLEILKLFFFKKPRCAAINFF